MTLEGRFGFVLPRFDGPTLLQLTRTGAMTRGQAGAILADLCRAVHKTPAAVGRAHPQRLGGRLVAGSSGRLPQHIATGILALIERLSPGDELAMATFTPAT